MPIGTTVGLFLNPMSVSAQDDVRPVATEDSYLGSGGSTTSARSNNNNVGWFRQFLYNYLNPTTQNRNGDPSVSWASCNIIPVVGTFNANECVKLVTSTIFFIILTISGYFLGIVGVFLEQVIKYTIININENLAGVTSIKTAWALIRDLANLSFIFILVYLAIDTILQTGRVNTGKALRQVIIVAILINFSYFFTQVIIDASNALAVTFYNLANSVKGSTGIDKGIMQGLGVSSLLATPEVVGVFAAKDWIAIIAWGLGGFVLIMVSGFVLFGIALILLIRYLVFIFVLITSAAGFAFSILPATQQYSKKWWNALINQSIVAPILFIFLWIVVTLINDEKFLPKGGNLSDAFVIPEGTIDATGAVASASGVGALLNFSIAIGLLVMAILAAVAVGAAGSKYVSNMGKKLNKSMGTGLAKRGGGALARGTIGRTALAIEDVASDSKYGTNFVARGLRSFTTGKLASAKYGTKLDPKKAAEERSAISQNRARILQRDSAEEEEEEQEKLDTTLSKDAGYIQQKDASDNAKKDLSSREVELKKLKEDREKETNVVSQLDFERRIKAIEAAVLKAKRKHETEKGALEVVAKEVAKNSGHQEKLDAIRRSRRPSEPRDIGVKGVIASTAAGAAIGSAAGPVGMLGGAAIGAGAAIFPAKARSYIKNFFDGSKDTRKKQREYRLMFDKIMREKGLNAQQTYDAIKEIEKNKKQEDDALKAVRKLLDDNKKPKKDDEDKEDK